MKTTDRHEQRLFGWVRATTSGLTCLFGALVLGSCAGTSAPTANQQTHVAKVEIVQHDPAAATFAVVLREAVIREAAYYGAVGRPITLRIEITRLHFKNAVQTLIVGDNNYVYGRGSVIDPATGQQTSTFNIQVDDKQGGLSGAGASVAMMVDPTGLVGKSVGFNRSGAATAMSANFAAETLRQIYGDARAKAVAKERQAAAKG